MHFHLAWSVQSIIDGESVSAASLTSLVSKRDALLQELESFVNLATDSNDGGKSGSELAGSVREL
jgi:cohesin complex subunit SA-1/2